MVRPYTYYLKDLNITGRCCDSIFESAQTNAITKQKKTHLNWKIVYIAWCAQVSSLHFQVHHQQNNMFALKQVSLMALLIALTYAAPQLDLEENAKNINTADYINVRDYP